LSLILKFHELRVLEINPSLGGLPELSCFFLKKILIFFFSVSEFCIYSIKLHYFYIFFTIDFFTNSENNLDYLNSFYLPLLIELTLASFLN
jgi:hypothetical protein